MKRLSFLIAVLLLFSCVACSSESPAASSLNSNKDTEDDISCRGEMPQYIGFEEERIFYIAYRYYQEGLPIPFEVRKDCSLGLSLSSFEDLSVFWTLVSLAEFPSASGETPWEWFHYYSVYNDDRYFSLCFELESWKVEFTYYPVTEYHNSGQKIGTMTIFGKSVDLYDVSSEQTKYSTKFLHKGNVIQVTLVPAMNHEDLVPPLPETPIEGGGLYVNSSGELIVNLGLKKMASWVQKSSLGDVFEVLGAPDLKAESNCLGYRLGDGKVLSLDFSHNGVDDPGKFYSPDSQLRGFQVEEFQRHAWMEYDASRLFSAWANGKSLEELLTIPLKPLYCIPGEIIIYRLEEDKFCAVVIGTREDKTCFVESVSDLPTSLPDNTWQPWDPAAFGLSPS